MSRSKEFLAGLEQAARFLEQVASDNRSFAGEYRHEGSEKSLAIAVEFDKDSDRHLASASLIRGLDEDGYSEIFTGLARDALWALLSGREPLDAFSKDPAVREALRATSYQQGRRAGLEEAAKFLKYQDGVAKRYNHPALSLLECARDIPTIEKCNYTTTPRKKFEKAP